MRYVDQHFKGETVELDGNHFVNCHFFDCKLVFHAYNPVSFDRCVFNECDWTFEGPAENMLDFLKALYHGLGPNGHSLVEVIFKGIQDGTFPASKSSPALAR